MLVENDYGRGKSIGSALALVAAFLCGCGSSGKSDRAKVLEELSSSVLLPGYEELDTESQTLADAVAAYCAAPEAAALDTAREAWRAARRSYRRTAAFQMGPSQDLRLASALDFWPVREQDVENAISNAPAAPDASYLATLGVAARGFPALEYLLFDPNDAALRLGAGDAIAAQRCAYAALLAVDVHEQSAQARASWQGFAAALAQAGEPGSSVTSTQAGIDLVLNSVAAAMVDVTDGDLARPLGEKAGGVPQPELCESRYAGDSIADYQAALESARNIWVGARQGERGRGLTLLVRRHDISFDERVRVMFSTTHERSSAISAPLPIALESDRASVESTLEAARELRRVMSTEVVQVIGGTLTFSDNDGD